jgi:hypothetical protein
MQDELNEFACENKLDFEEFKEDFCSRVEQLRDETQEKLDNMPEGLQQGPTGELLQARVDGLESWKDELDNVECDYDEEELGIEARDELGVAVDDESDDVIELINEKIQEKVDEAIEELRACSCDCE